MSFKGFFVTSLDIFSETFIQMNENKNWFQANYANLVLVFLSE